MAGELTVRRYDPADAAAVWAVHERALRASPLEFVEDAPADDDLLDVAEHYGGSGGEFLVGRAAGDIVAIGGFQPRGPETAEIRRMRVDPDAQRRGYGTRLLRDLEERARHAGVERAVLETHDRLAPAQQFYENHGYEPVRRAVHAITGDGRITYRKDL